MDKRELEILVPSKAVRDYVLKTGWIFTDAQKATLLANSWAGGQPLEVQLAHLRALQDATCDMELKGQITAYLDRMERHLRELKSNRDRSCVYILKVETDEMGDDYRRITPDDRFFDWKTACAQGKWQKRRFQIEKFPVTDEDSVISYVQFDRAGRAIYLSHTYDNTAEEKFVKAFCPLPDPFERGDIVRRIGLDGVEDYGIVETSQKRFQKDYERWKDDPNHFAEFGDDRIRVAFLDADGTFSHAHIIPMHLERYQPEWGPHDTLDGTRDNLLLEASAMYQGEGSLEELWYFTMEYRSTKNCAKRIV